MSDRSIAERHGDQLYGWFRDKFRRSPHALSRVECRGMFKYALEDLRREQRARLRAELTRDARWVRRELAAKRRP